MVFDEADTLCDTFYEKEVASIPLWFGFAELHQIEPSSHLARTQARC